MRIHGRYGMVYMNLAVGALAAPVAFLSDWSLTVDMATAETTHLGDPHRTYVPNTVEAAGDFRGFFDDSTRQMYTAVRDGIPRNFYLYPDTRDDPGQFWAGLVIPTFAVGGGIGAAVSVSGTWVAASEIRLTVPPGSLDAESGVQLQDEAGIGLLSEG